ncbi:MAG: hypothetical protein M3R35_07180 [Candidatus Eremiobacteraeota bacterium]|nr:hypothetical protein [Candidatus Eremiobacteraeota bacterium]
MNESMPRFPFGRHLFGAASFAFGIIALVWPDFKEFPQLRHLLNAHDGPVFVYAVAAAQMIGGIAIQFGRSARVGAIILGVVYGIFALSFVPGIVATPQVYDRWGNFFEQFSLVTGAALAYAQFSAVWTPAVRNRIGSVILAVCVISFAIEQAINLAATASLVPKWLPPSQTFWAAATTVAFALAALALLANKLALVATRLLTAMLAVFGLLVWLPILRLDHSHANWSETIETFAIAGTAWILADMLGAMRGQGRFDDAV